MTKGLDTENGRPKDDNPQDREEGLEQGLQVPIALPPGTPDRRRNGSTLTRQVSHDGFISIDAENEKKCAGTVRFRGSPVRCVSEFDRVTSQGEFAEKLHEICSSTSTDTSRLPNPLHNRRFLSHHVHSLRLEADLHPLRPILSRLMTHVAYNKKGLFNSPVDPVALRLPDYLTLIRCPMDLGTVKNRLYSAEYKSRDSATDDIRLCFRNAMQYNPSHNFVHIAARELLASFEDQLQKCPRPALSAADYTDQSHSSRAIPPATLTTHSQLPPSSTETADFKPHAPGAPHPERRRSKANSKHNCQWCKGKMCRICLQGCLGLEPALLVCNGQHCASKKITKGALYYMAPDGSCQYCQKCYTVLPPLLADFMSTEEPAYRYKRDLLKRKNEEELVEKWVSCVVCQQSVHHFCVLYNPFIDDEDSYICPECSLSDPCEPNAGDLEAHEAFSFITGTDEPVPMSTLGDSFFTDAPTPLMADTLPESKVSSFIQEKVQAVLTDSDCPDSAKTITVRVVSDCDIDFKVPPVIQNHFEVLRDGDNARGVSPPSKLSYRSKAIVLFQKIDGLDVCIFCMYVHEYHGSSEAFDAGQERRVYIAYLDSVEYFRPRSTRTAVYHEILTAYLATARKRKFTAAHIWACPPSRGNSFVFWNHPASQRTPNMERLTAWYNAALHRAAQCGVVADVMSLYESDFEESVRRIQLSSSPGASERMPCPPLIDGDFWIEEATRLHSIEFAKRSRDLLLHLDSPLRVVHDSNRCCPAIAISTMIRTRIMTLPSSLAFRRPVNAAAMRLANYHSIVRKPMDLSTVHTKCLLGEYKTLRHLVDDVELMFANAKKFNPPGHIVYVNATELRDFFFRELDSVTRRWCSIVDGEDSCWVRFESTSLLLDATLQRTNEATGCGSSVSAQCLPPCETVPDMKNLHASSSFVDITSGPKAIEQRMINGDADHAEGKRTHQKCAPKKNKRKKIVDGVEEPVVKRRRQTWLGEEVADSVRRIRTSIFKCLLSATDGSRNQAAFIDRFEQYASSFDASVDEGRKSPVADARQGLLEFSQFRHLEFDTLRRAKYSSSVLLHHFHNRDAPGLVPSCTSCGLDIKAVRWHRIGRVFDQSPNTMMNIYPQKQRTTSSKVFSPQEFCSDCFKKSSCQDSFIPLTVSLNA